MVHMISFRYRNVQSPMLASIGNGKLTDDVEANAPSMSLLCVPSGMAFLLEFGGDDSEPAAAEGPAAQCSVLMAC